MNILFVLYGGFNTNSANPLVLYARELQKIGHNCTIAVPTGLDTVYQHDNISFRPVLFKGVLADPRSVFPDGRQADVIHACTPREVVRRFVTSYMRIYPTPLVIYLEDNERWIAVRELDMNEESLARNTAQEISDKIPGSLSHPFYYDSFIGLADAVAVIQDKLSALVPFWVPCETVMLGVDINFFSPQPADPNLREKYGAKTNEKVLVYHGGMNKFTRPAIRTLCEAVGMINQRGFPCRLLRSGPYPLDFHKELTVETKSVISNLGMLPRKDLPGLLALAEVFVQPGEIDLFEDLRLPGKVPEFLAMGRPVLMPDVNIAHLFENGKDAIILSTGTADEIAEKCIDLFLNPEKSEKIGNAGRIFAEKYFDVCNQAKLLEMTYKTACERFNPGIAVRVWQDNDENIDVTSLLMNKLRLMAKDPNDKHFVEVRKMFGEYANNIESTQHRIGGLEGRLVETDNYNMLLNQKVAERDRQISNLVQAVTVRDNTINNLLSSTSWRITRPLRAIKSFQESLLKRFNTAWGLNPTTEKSVIIDRNDNRKDYIEWVRRYDTITDEMRDAMHTCIDGFIHKPLISVLMPTYNPVAEWLIDAIESVRQQNYPHWELCIADDASTDKAIRPILERFAKKDSRIKVVFREKNGHISAATNSALKLATGEWVALLDHDDLLREHALFWVADAVVTHPDAGIIYSDEDKIDPSGRRYDPHFKPDWNPDLFLSYNLICHLGAYRTDLVRKLGGFREGYEGAQDYDVALRCTEQILPKQIVHIPRVLYHWRSHPGSTAQARTEKDYALLAGERVLNDHFARVNVSAQAELLYFGMYRVRYTIPVPTPLVSLIIPTRNGLNLIKQCIDSISTKTTYKNYEIIVVDNNSDDPETLEYFASLAGMNRIRILRDEHPFNYSALNNAAVQHAHGEYVGLINNDIEVISPDWLDEMMGLAIQPGVGAVGARLWYPNDTLQHGGCITGIGGVAGHSHKHLPRGQYGYFSRAHLIQTLSAVTAACLVIKKSIYQEMGGLEETNLKVTFNDVDFCLRVREAGYRNVWTPYAELYHYESATRGREITSENQLRFKNEVLYMQKRWGNVLLSDPAYSPNLTLEGEDFAYAWPPRVNPTGNLLGG